MMRRIQRGLLAAAMLCIAAGAPLHAQSGKTASGSLVVSMQVQSSISLQFVNNGSGVGYCQLTGAGTNSASLNLGIASVAGDNLDAANGGCVNWSGGGSSYSIYNYVYVDVTESNSTSANYSLTAALASAPESGVTWKFTSMSGNLSTTPSTIVSSENYNTNFGMQLEVTVTSSAASGSIGATIDFTATAN